MTYYLALILAGASITTLPQESREQCIAQAQVINDSRPEILAFCLRGK